MQAKTYCCVECRNVNKIDVREIPVQGCYSCCPCGAGNYLYGSLAHISKTFSIELAVYLANLSSKSVEVNVVKSVKRIMSMYVYMKKVNFEFHDIDDDFICKYFAIVKSKVGEGEYGNYLLDIYNFYCFVKSFKRFGFENIDNICAFIFAQKQFNGGKVESIQIDTRVDNPALSVRNKMNKLSRMIGKCTCCGHVMSFSSMSCPACSSGDPFAIKEIDSYRIKKKTVNSYLVFSSLSLCLGVAVKSLSFLFVIGLLGVIGSVIYFYVVKSKIRRKIASHYQSALDDDAREYFLNSISKTLKTFGIDRYDLK